MKGYSFQELVNLAEAAVKRAGDTMTGNLTAPAVLVSSAQNTSVNALTRKDYVDTALNKKLNLTGDTMTGTLVVPAFEGLRTSALAPSNFYASISAESDWVMLWRRNQSAGVKADEFVGINGSSQLRFRQDKGLGNGTYVDWLVYHQGFKPTAAEVGAVSKAGDTMTGPLFVVPAGGGNYGLGLSSNSAGYGELVGRDSAGVVDWASGLRWYAAIKTWAIGTNKIYHEGFKPNPTDVGAQPGLVANINESTNWNTLTLPGTYSVSSSGGPLHSTGPQNYPYGQAIITGPANGNGVVVQVYYPHNTSDKVAWRVTYDSSNPANWTAWHYDYNQNAKPTAADVGAVPVVGTGSMKGDLFVGDLVASHQVIINASSAAIDWKNRSAPAWHRHRVHSDGNFVWDVFQTDGTYVGTPMIVGSTSCGISSPFSLNAQGVNSESLTRKDYVDSQIYTRAPTTHNHTAAQGNADIVGGSTGVVGSYMFACLKPTAGSTVNPGTHIAGSNLHPAGAVQYSENRSLTLAGTWMACGSFNATNTDDQWDDRNTLFIRVA